ncbi:MAG TPA: MFS transporter [Clostridiaceae bacterium]|nr:MFS transporter [Clostridiaceae bacterium]
MVKKQTKLWLVIVLFGLAGQIAWTVENMYFNIFLYNTVTTDPDAIATMVGTSAIVATVTTILIGALSDKLGKRKPFMVWGYILWGLSTMSFAFISTNSMAEIFPKTNDIVALTTFAIIFMDCVMTFFGSSANDAAFNAYVTENAPQNKRTMIEGLLSAFPLVSMLIIFGVLYPLTQAGKWKEFFIYISISIILTGIIGFFIIPQDKLSPSKNFRMADVLYGFRPNVLIRNPPLLLALFLLLLVSIAFQVYLPYLLIYVQHHLAFDNYVPLLGIVLIGASVFSVLGGRLADKTGKMRLFPYTLLLSMTGLVFMFFARKYFVCALAALIFMTGALLSQSITTAMVRENIPEGMAGRFQGVRMFFAVLLPMLIGPFIGARIISKQSLTYTDLGQVKQVPGPEIFLGAAAVLLIPLAISLISKKHMERRSKNE